MRIDTKFDFRDEVYNISWDMKREWVRCGFCDGTGRMEGKDGSNKMCTECYGRNGHHKNIKTEWMVKNKLTIGTINVKIICANEVEDDDDDMFDNFGSQTESYHEEYMCYETGIGSGHVWGGDNLFASKEEAQAECDKRNKVDKDKKA